MRNLSLSAWVLAVVGSAVIQFSAVAGEADIIAATATQQSDGRWTVAATVEHADEGWDHYADAFEVVGPDGAVLGTRVLHHPHVEEQPFTRSLRNIEIDASVSVVTVRAKDNVHGLGGAEFELQLDR